VVTVKTMLLNLAANIIKPMHTKTGIVLLSFGR
jgi:hypothetical protein